MSKAQDTISISHHDLSNSNFKLKKKQADNAVLLVENLTEKAGSDKEKFDAIFYWTANNIKYSTSHFYAPINSSPEQISEILKNKKTICLGYAQLMDSLCRLAGLESMVVYGYSKDEFYDVNDTIYGHNHAWNAIKLDGLWYLYDVTWSTGKMETHYQKFSKWLLQLRSKYPPKFKKRLVKLPKKLQRRFECAGKVNKVYYYKQRFFNRLIQKWIYRWPIKYYQRYKKNINTDFYLSNPEIFAASHVPDDPVWSLLDRKKSAEFERDSLFYYLNDSLLKNQERHGKACKACDSIYNYNAKNRFVALRTHGLDFNPNNRFITAYCSEEIGKIDIAKSINSSEAKFKYADSSLIKFNEALSEIALSKSKMNQFFKGAKRKNDYKAKLLLTENKTHERFFKEKMKMTQGYRRKFQEMINKTMAFSNVYRNQRKKFAGFKTDFNPQSIKPYSAKRISDLQSSYHKKIEVRDSLVSKLSILQTDYDSVVASLQLNIWPRVLAHDTIVFPFIKCIENRMNFLDNYKKKMVDIRRRIPDLERVYSSNISHIVYDRATRCVLLFNEIALATKEKNALNRDLLKLKLELTKAGEFSNSELEQFKSDVIQSSKEDYCWLMENYPSTYSSLMGFIALNAKQKWGVTIVKKENVIERKRQSILNKAIKEGYKYSIKSLSQHNALVKRKQKEISKNRNLLLDPLKFDPLKYNQSVERIEKLFKLKDVY